MITEPSSTVVPPEVSQNIDTLRSQIESLQQELTQAQTVWQETLAHERKNFEDLLERKELASKEQESQWARQSQGYEERLAEISSEFDYRLKQMEQNAARALVEIDDAWQRDKLEWGPAAQSEWPRERQELEARIQALDAKVAELEAARASEAARAEEAAKSQAVVEPQGPTQETVQALQGQLQEFQQTVAELQDRASNSDNLVNACVQALDYQISVLYDLVHQFAAPAPLEEPSRAES